MPAPRPLKSSPQDAKPVAKPAPKLVAVKPPPKPAPVADNKPAPKPVPQPAPAPSSNAKPSAPKPVQAPDSKPQPVAAPKPVFVPTPTPAADNKPTAPTKPQPVPVFQPTPVATPVAVIASSYDADQIQNQKTVVSLCESNHVPMLGTLAALCAGSGENTWHTDGCNNSNHCGFWQLDSTWQAMHDYHDVEYWTRYAIQHGFYGQGGLSAIAKAHPDWRPGDVAQACQGAGPSPTWPNPADYYQSKVGEAEAVYNRYKSSSSGAGSIPGVTLVPTALLYANPLKDANVTAKRIDQGVDYAGTGHYSAIAAGVVTTVWTPAPGWPGNMIQYKITQKGALEDVFVYYAEGIKTDRTAGDTFKAGDWLCSLIPTWPTATEIGFASSPGDDATWAKVFGGGYNEGDLTRAGIAMSNLIHRLGGPAGLEEGRTPVGDWPPWFKNGVIPADLATASGPAQQSAGVTAVQHPSAKVGAKDYSWPATQLEAWTALDKGTVGAVVRSKAARDYAAGVTFVKATEDGN